MGKRSQFKRNPRDYYPTPYEAVIPLLPFLHKKTEFIEPCAGDGRLIKHLESAGHRCLYACDIAPQAKGIEQRDILLFDKILPWCETIITNPVWDRTPLHAMINIFRVQAPTWLLFDAGWAYTQQAADLLKYCSRMVAVGRVRWIEGTDMDGKDDAVWYRFEKERCSTVFSGR